MHAHTQTGTHTHTHTHSFTHSLTHTHAHMHTHTHTNALTHSRTHTYCSTMSCVRALMSTDDADTSRNSTLPWTSIVESSCDSVRERSTDDRNKRYGNRQGGTNNRDNGYG